MTWQVCWRGALVSVGLVWASGAAMAAPPTDDVLRVAVLWGAVQDVSRTDVETSMKLWATELTQALELPSEVRLYDSVAEIRRALASGQANFVMADGLSFVKSFDLSTLSDGLAGDVLGYSYRLATELNPQVRERIQVLERLPIYAGPMGLFSARLNPLFREYVTAKVPQMNHSPRGQQLIELLQTEKLSRFSKDRLDPLRALVQEHDTLRQRAAPRGVTR